jgi:hypothetical protein
MRSAGSTERRQRSTYNLPLVTISTSYPAAGSGKRRNRSRIRQVLHTLVIYRPSTRADDALRRLCLAARDSGTRVTVLAVAREEPTSSGCCDTRSVLWNRICHELAREHLARAAQVVGREGNVDFGVVVAQATDAVDALTGEAVARAADEIVLADPPASGLGRLERRRLRRSSPVPVSA